MPAIIFAEIIILMNPMVQKHVDFASGYLDLRMYEDAMAEADSALAFEPDLTAALLLKSAILWKSNRLSEAEPILEKIAEITPSDSSIWINLAYIRRRTRSLDAAVETLQRAFEVNPKDALAHFNMACYRAVQKRPTEAIALLKSALCLNPKLKKLTRAESDFDSVRHLPEFKKLVR